MKQKKFLAFVTAAAMITANSTSLMPDKFVNLPVFNANAADIVASGECGVEGDNATWTLDNNGTLTISGEGKIKCGWKEYINQVSLSSPIKKVIIDGNITEIGNLTFTFCDNLSEITIPETVTYIGESAFSFCSNLTSITIPDSVTSIGEDAFSYSGMNSITIPESITNIAASTFANCKNLTSVTLPDSITSIGLGAFSGCDKLKEIKLPSSLTTVGDGAFELCLGLEKIDIPKNVSNIGEDAFLICENLTAITVDENNEYYTSESGVLFNKEKTTLILYPAQKTDKKYIIPDSVIALSPFSFAFNENLTEIEIPNTIAVIDENIFRNCSALTSVIIPETVKSIGESAFADCTKLTSITIKNPECEIFDSENTFSNYETEEPYKLNFDGTIYGYEDSTAQVYAEKYNRIFVALDGKKPITTTAITTTSTSTTTSVTTATTTTPPVTTEPYFILGDVNADGSVDSSDASLVLAEYAKIQTGGAGEFTKTQFEAADVNNDNVVDSSDASKILAYYAMISTGKKSTWD